MERTARASWVRHACIHYQALSGRARESVPKLQLGSVLTAPSNSGGEKRDGWMDGRVDGWTDGLVRDTVGDRAGWARKQHLWCIPYCPRMAHLGSHSGASSVSVEDVKKMCEHLKSHSLASMDLEAVARSGPTGGYGHRRQGRLGLQWFQLPLIPAGLRRSAGNGRPGGNPGAGTWPVPKLARRTRVAANAGVHPTATKARPPNHGRLPPLPARAVRAPDCPPAPARDPPMGEEELQDPPQPPRFHLSRPVHLH